MADRLRDQAGRMQEQGRAMAQKTPNSRKVLGVFMLMTGTVVTLVLGGITVGGIGVTLMLAAPLFLLFSPVLVPLAIMVALGIGGFLLASTAFLAFCSMVSWVYNYARGRHPVGANQIDAAKHTIADTAMHVSEKAREVTHLLQSKAQETLPGA